MLSDEVIGALVSTAGAIFCVFLAHRLSRRTSRQRIAKLSVPHTSSPVSQAKELRLRPIAQRVGSLGCTGWLLWFALNTFAMPLGWIISRGMFAATMFQAPEYNRNDYGIVPPNRPVKEGSEISYAVELALIYLVVGIVQWTFVRAYAKDHLIWLVGAAVFSIFILLLYLQPTEYLLKGCFLGIVACVPVYGGPFLVGRLRARDSGDGFA